ncbi:hypothetical protein GCM10027577_30140 [Spirosoma fluminis]
MVAGHERMAAALSTGTSIAYLNIIELVIVRIVKIRFPAFVTAGAVGLIAHVDIVDVARAITIALAVDTIVHNLRGLSPEL